MFRFRVVQASYLIVDVEVFSTWGGAATIQRIDINAQGTAQTHARRTILDPAWTFYVWGWDWFE
ncbi:hypothetical protein BQ8794_50737 [Mesorhizobium prunaredense]|uniref:Uncharacterized protein n=1 Tax=Mesorhizobium prunaredense TaxID=1631249 RepID=A0A1R3VFM8_9HYPH|nr:hypothetical protein BQ8794_50737 [Mesorhizobium prunaredense]